MPTESNPPKVFISYSHDSHAHQDRVLALADRLRREGIDCNLDQYEPSPAEGWPNWMSSQFEEADFILIVCTKTYRLRFEGKEEKGKGLGVKWEGAIITRELYQSETTNKRFIPVVFDSEDIRYIPQHLSDYTFYRLDDSNSYEELYCRLTNQPRVLKPDLGKIRSVKPVNKLPSLHSENRRQEFTPIRDEPLPKIQFFPPPKPPLKYKNFIEDLGNGVKLEMIAIPGGSFLMGPEDFDNTKPVHRVKLSPFHIGKYQVTQRQWQAVMGDNPSHFKGDNLPVERVSWEMAVEFCEKLSKQTGKNYLLPTEAEWEYACLAGSTGKYCFGDDEALLKKYAWYSKNSDSKTHPVGEKLPNDWGLYDMHGNVWEWCQDWYDENYYADLSKQGEAINPQGPANGKYRVLRGGSWCDDRDDARAVCRSYVHPAFRYDSLGFRLVSCRPPSSS